MISLGYPKARSPVPPGALLGIHRGDGGLAAPTRITPTPARLGQWEEMADATVNSSFAELPKYPPVCPAAGGCGTQCRWRMSWGGKASSDDAIGDGQLATGLPCLMLGALLTPSIRRGLAPDPKGVRQCCADSTPVSSLFAM